MEDNNALNGPTPCTAGCGFYGSKIYNQMCSKCFKEQEAQNKQGQVELPNATEMNALLGSSEVIQLPAKKEKEAEPIDKPVKAKEEGEEEKEKEISPVQKTKGRCFICRLKIPLAKQLSNKCRCEYVFCDSHRFPDKHNCDFDHASMDKGILAKNNPKLNDRPRGGRSFQRLDSL
ncbi:hypothetical protein CLU79DRAFT_137617 [Phycomyces nitens]|nr:hypothetical protein CLU79DRAFT_137617 [Phycomyces nitens]